MPHKSAVIVTVVTLNVPHVDEAERVTVDDLGYRDDGITHLTASSASRTTSTCRDAAPRRQAAEARGRARGVSYFLSRTSIVPGDEPGMARWRKKLFTAIALNAASPVPYFHLPDERTIVMAAHIEL